MKRSNGNMPHMNPETMHAIDVYFSDLVANKY